MTVPRHRKVPARVRERIDVRYADLPPEAVRTLVTDPVTTVLACARSLPFDEALTIADSALRAGAADRRELAAAAESSPRTGRPQARRVMAAADRRSANAFESVVRAISLDVPGLSLEPQVKIAPSITPDLVDRQHRIVVECDSWTYHAERSAFGRDIERYNLIQLEHWLLVRVGFAHAMERPAYVRDVLGRAVAAARARSNWQLG